MAQKPTVLLWLRNDLRMADNPALSWAAAQGAVAPVYIHDDSGTDPSPPGGATRWWLEHALTDLGAQFQKHGVPLILRRGDPAKILPALAKEMAAKAVAWSRGYEPALAARDDKIAEMLRQQDVEISIHTGFLLFNPESIRSGGGTPYKVYTPFSRTCLSMPAPAKPLPAPKNIEGAGNFTSDKLSDWYLTPRKATWPEGLADTWTPTEAGAHEQLEIFIDEALKDYKIDRDRPDRAGTSRMSPYLHFGQISPRQLWHTIHDIMAKHPATSPSGERYILELLWREFSWHLLQHFPDMQQKPLMPAFAKFPWRQNHDELQAWQKGLTGYPIVDAGMRQLWRTGWMHNRVRMIVASFLIKDLLIDWREGMAWFWDTLVDADLGNNTASWQWVAGCGADAAPYYRIFNPTLQGQKFDPNGDYVREYVPELAKLGADVIHEPWAVPPMMLAECGVTLGKTYPLPIVQHDKARLRALAALAEIKGNKP